jgi:hypothetical protein
MLQVLLILLALAGLAGGFILRDQGYSPWWGLGFAAAMLVILIGTVLNNKRQERNESISITR